MAACEWCGLDTSREHASVYDCLTALKLRLRLQDAEIRQLRATVVALEHDNSELRHEREGYTTHAPQ